MDRAGGFPVSPGLECTRLSPPGRETRRLTGDARGTSIDSWCCMVAAGMAVVVLLSMSAGQSFRISPSFAVPGNHLIRAVAWTRPAVPDSDIAVCAAGPAVVPSYPRDEDSLQLEKGDSSRASAWGFRLADAGGYSSAPAVSGLSGPTGIGCGRVAGWATGPLAMAFWPHIRPVRHSIHLLAFRKWAAEEPAEQESASCVIAGFPRRPPRLDPVLAHARTHGIHRLWYLGKGSLAGADRWKPTSASSADRVLACPVRSNRQPRAPPSDQWCAAYSGGGQVGSGDRASLPGRSSRYRVIWLVCERCGTTMACLFYDDGDAPLCVNPLHGQMEVLR